MKERALPKRWGYFRHPCRTQYFVWVDPEANARINEIAQNLLVGQGTLIAWMMEELLKNEKFLNVILRKITERDDYKEVKHLAIEYQKKMTARRQFEQNNQICVKCLAVIERENIKWHEKRCTGKIQAPMLKFLDQRLTPAISD